MWIKTVLESERNKMNRGVHMEIKELSNEDLLWHYVAKCHETLAIMTKEKTALKEEILHRMNESK